MSLVAKLALHSQQICGLAWPPGGQLLESGGNDNLCCLIEVGKSLGHPPSTDQANLFRRAMVEELGARSDDSRRPRKSAEDQSRLDRAQGQTRMEESATEANTTLQTFGSIRTLGSGSVVQLWVHRAAVKAIAFCPWRDGLVATGGGSNDKCIHFFHTSGSALATIAVAAQVTSLIWSTTRREIAATFGYAHPEHPYRVAVFSWPECRQIAEIPWEGELRALYAISYPWCMKGAGRPRKGPAASEGCIVVASSDETVKFHELWSTEERTAVATPGMLGGSDILEDLEGIVKEGDVTR